MYDFLFVTYNNDVHSIELSKKLAEKGYNCFLFCVDSLATDYKISYNVSNDNALNFSIRDKYESVDLQSINCVVFRGKIAPKIPDEIPQKYKKHMEDESATLLKWIRSALDPDIFCFPSDYDNMYKGANKLFQLKMAKEVGLVIPESCIGNNAEKVENILINKNIDNFSLKTLDSYVITENLSFTTSLHLFGKTLLKNIFAFNFNVSTLKKSWIKERSELLPNQKIKSTDFFLFKSSFHYYPVIIQKYIDKSYELRITIVGKKIYSVKLLTQANPNTLIDSRTQLAEDEAEQVPCELPEEVQCKLLRLMEKLKLDFGCIDMIVTPSQEYVFLEINPGGNYLWVEYFSKLPITNGVADYLIEKCESVKQKKLSSLNH